MIETLAPQRTDQALHERILPGAARRNQNIFSGKTLQQATEVGSVAAVAIPQEVCGRGVVGKGFPDLLSGPGGGRMVGHIQMDDTTTVVGQDDEDEQDAEGRRWDREEVDRGTLREVRSQEGAPRR